MIAVVNYGMGNLRSVTNALTALGCEWTVTSDADVIRSADKVLLPGVGNAAEAMEKIHALGLDSVIRGLRQPVLGICVGLQVMCRDSEEGNVKCLGIFDSHVKKFVPSPEAKVPHMGWNSISNFDKKSKIFSGLPSGSFVYYVHSFYPTLCQDTAATTRHGDVLFSAALRWENFYGTQFHPEKSGDTGSRILKNFVEL